MPVEPPEVKGLLPGRGPAGRAPGRGAWPPGRGAPGRSPRPWPPCWPPGRGAPGRGAWPPGRGAPGRVPEPWPCEAAGAAGADGGAVNSGVVGAGDAGAGRGAGFGPGVGRGPEEAGAAGAAGFSAAGFGAGGRGAAGRAACAGEGAPGFAGAALRAAGLPPPLPCWRASVSLRTTGASMVEDAERTNSPSSWSLAMTTLLSTPNSLASSYTRTLATSLLLGPGCGRTVATSWAYSSRTHRVLIAISTYFRLARYQGRTGFRATLLTVLPARQLSSARRTGATPLCRALPGRATPS